MDGKGTFSQCHATWGESNLTLLEVVLYDGDEVLRVDDALEGRAADDGLVGEDLDGAGAGGGGMLRQGGRSGAVARLLQELNCDMVKLQI